MKLPQRPSTYTKCYKVTSVSNFINGVNTYNDIKISLTILFYISRNQIHIAVKFKVSKKKKSEKITIDKERLAILYATVSLLIHIIYIILLAMCILTHSF